MQDALVRLSGITKSFAERAVLRDVDLQINSGDRLGIVGVNGAGKSTLLDLIAGLTSCDSGVIDWFRKDCSVHYLTQSRNEALNTPESHELQVWAKQIGLKDALVQRGMCRLQNASGGEKTKIAIAHAFTSNADILILDEPTNHLDSGGISWLIREINRYAGTVVMVSHDRYFLDHTVTHVAYLNDGRLSLYNGNYSFFVSQREQERLTQLRNYEQRQKEQERLEAQIAQVEQWAEQGHRKAGKQGTLSERRQMGYKQFHRAKAKKLDQRAKSQIKRLEKLRSEPIEKPVEHEFVKFEVSQAVRHGKALIEARGITKQFGEHVLFTESSFFLQRGDRVGLYGPNGCGKTTLLKIIIGAESLDQGELWRSPSLKIGYLSQDDMLDSDRVLGELERHMPTEQWARFRAMLANMGLNHQKMISKHFSFGERVRLKLAWLAFQDYNLLILDEPTNHLDIASREELERALVSYNGTLLVATHDRYFMERLCTKLLVFENRRIIKKEYGLKEVNDRNLGKVHSSKGPDSNIEDQLMLIQTRITQLLGDLSTMTPKQEEYLIVSSELDSLLKRRRELIEKRR